MTTGADKVAQDIRAAAAAAGVRIWLHARSLSSGQEVGVAADEPVVLASVLKIAVAVELARQAARGRIGLDERITLRPAELTPSPSGLGVLSGPVTLPIRDLAVLMLSLSDNAATDVLIARLGAKSLDLLTEELGLTQTAIPEDCAAIIRSVGEDLGLGYTDDESALDGVDPARLRTLRALDPTRTCRSTARETVQLLTAVWRDQVDPPEAAALVRAWMSHQAWEHRLASGFDDEITVVGKTGTLPGLRNEAGVVTYPDGRDYAVAVFTRDDDFRSRSSARDHFLGRAARMAVEELRRTDGQSMRRPA
ncbi:serine hydrolase [Kribbella solani]|uniref:Beta-lactamase class A n=1 Tax=Kribbella solani TaxID=236067 RepID=A0A841DDY9_9ACTN|nr:serine hydrolase [Kribbella solani]MBB5977284.1 beta-lactamase class A [Kribbella solani]